MSTRERFYSKVAIGAPNECWNWLAFSPGRYGKFFLDGKVQYAHRAAFMLEGKVIPDYACVLHKCDNNMCVNPAHLYLGDQKQNAADRKNRGRSANFTGSRNPNAKLSPEQVAKIAALPDTVSHVNVAPLYGVTPETISHIRRGKTWGEQNIGRRI